MAVHHSTPTAEPPTSPIAHLTVRDAMQLGLFMTPPDADLETVARTMAEKSIHCVLIAGIQAAAARVSDWRGASSQTST